VVGGAAEGVVERVGPRAGGVDRKRAVATGGRSAPGGGRAVVDVARAERAAGARVARKRRVARGDAGLADRAGSLAGRRGDHGRVVGAGVGYGVGLGGVVSKIVGPGRCEFFPYTSLFRSVVGGAAEGVVERVGPRAGGVDRKRAVATGGRSAPGGG